MAYSNWGGKVWRDGDALHENCDATVPQVLGGEPRYAHYIFHYTKGNALDSERMYHAIVGDKDAGILVCLYKNWIYDIRAGDGSLLLRMTDVDRSQSALGAKDYDAGGTTIRCSWRRPGVEVAFVDAVGRAWRGESGYQNGEGFGDWS